MSDPGGQAAGWYPDPTGRHQYRYWSGSSWTDNVSDGGVASTDPMGGPGPVFPPGAVAAPTTRAARPSSRRPLLIGAAVVAVLGVAAAAFALTRDDDTSGLGTFTDEVDGGEVFVHRVKVPAGSLLTIRVEPEDDFDPVLGVSAEADVIDELEDYFGTSLSDSFTDYFGDVDDIPGHLFQVADSGASGDREISTVTAPVALEVNVIVAGYQGDRGEFELEVSSEDFDGEFSDFGSDFSDFQPDFSDLTDLTDFGSDFTDLEDLSDLPSFTEFSDLASDFFTDFELTD
ncbi:hypothetical protein BH18ACT4_BH18ACT4_09660 [soil metagenome]